MKIDKKDIKTATITCFHCKQVVVEFKMMNDLPTCTDCISENYFTCDGCGDSSLSNNEHTLDDKSLCSTCYSDLVGVCIWCDEDVYFDLMMPVVGGDVCKACYENHAIMCSCCGNMIHVDDAHNGEDGIYCEICYDNNEYNDNRKSDNPTYVYHKTKKDKHTPRLYFGIEIELENDEYTDVDLPEFIWAKIEDSLSCEGAEFVTHPLTYNWILEHKNEIENVLNKLDLCGFANDRACGIHIHLSRKCFSPLHLFKFITLFNISTDFTLQISGRGCRSDLAQWANTDMSREIMIGGSKGQHMSSRFYAVNVSNTHTVEVRIFSSTTDMDDLMAKIQICLSAFEYTKNCSVMNISTNDYLGYIKQNKKRFKELYKYMVTKNLLTDFTKRKRILETI